MAAVTVCSDLGTQENRICHCFHSSAFFAVKWWGCVPLSFSNAEFQANFFLLLFHPHQEALLFLFTFATLVVLSLSLHSCHLLLDYDQVALIHGPYIPGSYAISFFTAKDFGFTARHIHNCVIVCILLWPSCFIPSGTISNCLLLFQSSILDTFLWVGRGGSSFGVISCCLFILFLVFLRYEYCSGLPMPPPVDYILSELFPMTHLSWVTLHQLVHSFIELPKPLCHDKAVIHERVSLSDSLWPHGL